MNSFDHMYYCEQDLLDKYCQFNIVTMGLTQQNTGPAAFSGLVNVCHISFLSESIRNYLM